MSRDTSLNPDALYASLQRDPILRRYGHYAQLLAHTGGANREPWAALGDQRFMALSLVHPRPDMALYKDPGEEAPPPVLDVATRLIEAATYSWSHEVMGLLNSYPVPPHVIGRDLLPTPSSYHCYQETSLPVEQGGLPMLINGVLLADEGIGLVVTWFLFGDIDKHPEWAEPGADRPPRRATRQVLPYGARFPDDFPPERRGAAQLVLSMCSFLASEYIEAVREKLPRPMRRHDLAGSPAADRLVSVVRLRRQAREAMAAHDADVAAGRTYTHRWWVQGHHRQQWYPSLQAHQVKWIRPYLKGPEDAELLPRVYDVSR